MKMHALAVGAYDTAALLSAVLKAVKRIVCILRRILDPVYAEHSAFVVYLLEILHHKAFSKRLVSS